MSKVSRARVVGNLMVAAVLAAVGLGAMISAVIFIANGQPDMENAIILGDVDTDFEDLGVACNVTTIRHCWYTTSDEQDPSIPASMRKADGQTTCWQAYIAHFMAPGSTDMLQSWPEYVADGQRDCSEGCHNEPAPSPMRSPSGAFEVNKAHRCWKATRRVDQRYMCGNYPCFKLSDPRLISQPAIDGARLALGVGGGLLGLALLSCCACTCLLTSLARSLQATDTPTVTPTPTPTPTPASHGALVALMCRRWPSTTHTKRAFSSLHAFSC